MQSNKFITLLIFILSICPMYGKAFKLSGLAEISVITCSPGNESYSVYGHSAIRVKDDMVNYDIVFNYGIFDFSAPNFVYRFASGQTDYLLGAYKFEDFIDEYIREKRGVFEQILDFRQEEKQKLFDFLIWNARPENRVYRYNFLYDNCSSRIRDVVKANVNGEVIFSKKSDHPQTFRQLIKKYHSKLKWLNFGIDLVVCAPADKIATVNEEMFLPDYLMDHFANAEIKTGNELRPLVKNSQVIYDAPKSDSNSFNAFSPFVVFFVLFLVIAFISVKQLRKNKITVWPDYLIFGINGFMGVTILWFVIYSEHPAMSPNFNLLWAVPLNLIFAVAWKVKKWRNITRYYFLIISLWYILFIVCSSFLPQKFHPVFYLLILIVLCRSLLHLYIIFKERNFSLKS